MSLAPTLVWFRQDLRLADNPALHAAAARGGPVFAVYVWAPDEEGAWPPGGATKWWLHRSLAALAADLAQRGNRLILRQGASLDTLRALAKESGATAVYWNRRYEPASIARDREIKIALREDGLDAQSFNGNLLIEPPTFFNKTGGVYKVFTPFWKAAAEHEVPAPLPAPEHLPAPKAWPASAPLASLALGPSIAWDAGLAKAWTPGEAGAWKEVDRFRDDAAHYPEQRDNPGISGTSRLSPHLHFGEISPRSVLHAARAHAEAAGEAGAVKGTEAYIRQLYWREFAHYLLYHFPHTPAAPLREEFARFPWTRNDAALRAWQRGKTGYPLVDAGMRELWITGWMHNRVRMVVASFLVKHLLLPWQAGAAWFWDTLVDADLANNTLGWQWTSGCGADAAPYFRIFNPMSQGEKFDPECAYVRRWLPELAALPNEYIYRPWEAPPLILQAAGITLGDTYPLPIVDHPTARDRALAAYAEIKLT